MESFGEAVRVQERGIEDGCGDEGTGGALGRAERSGRIRVQSQGQRKESMRRELNTQELRLGSEL